MKKLFITLFVTLLSVTTLTTVTHTSENEIQTFEMNTDNPGIEE